MPRMPRPTGGKPFTPPKIRETSHYFEGDYLFLFQEIVIDKEKIGTVFIQHGLDEIRGQLARYIAIVCFVILVAFLVALCAILIPAADHIQPDPEPGPDGEIDFPEKGLFGPGGKIPAG